MSIISSAKSELKLINFGEEDTAVMIEILTKFLDQWDSGGAVYAVAPILMRLIAGKPLKPLTGNQDEWIDHDNCFQNKRCGTVFKTKEDIPHRGLKAGDSYNIDDVPLKKITFPYWPEKAEISSPVVEINIPDAPKSE